MGLTTLAGRALTPVAGYGFGDGSADGYGYSDGSGSGYGDGYGYGDGTGDGHCDIKRLSGIRLPTETRAK